MKISIFDDVVLNPLYKWGLKSNFWGIHIHTLIYTWIGMLLLFSLVIIGKIFLKKQLNVISLVTEQAVEFLQNLCQESFGSKFRYQYFYFIATIFFFTLSGCLVGLLPFVDESTKDLNTAFALGSLSFLYVQYQKIKVHGFIAFLKEFTQPFFILLPLNIIGELAKVASMSFRLFGNILGGSIIFLIAIEALKPYKIWFVGITLGILLVYVISKKVLNPEKSKKQKFFLTLLGWSLFAVFAISGAQMFFGIFEGFVQSFVLTMLTVTYLAVAIQDEDMDDSAQKTAKGEV